MLTDKKCWELELPKRCHRKKSVSGKDEENQSRFCISIPSKFEETSDLVRSGGGLDQLGISQKSCRIICIAKPLETAPAPPLEGGVCLATWH